MLLVFGLLTVTSLSVSWVLTTPGNPEAGLSMGGMMNRHHIDLLTPERLLAIRPEPHTGSLESGGQVTPLVAAMGFISTFTVFLAVPLLLGGAVMLTILWY